MKCARKGCENEVVPVHGRGGQNKKFCKSACRHMVNRRNWNAANPEKRREIDRVASRNWSAANPEKHRARSRKWREANLEKSRLCARNWSREEKALKQAQQLANLMENINEHDHIKDNTATD